MILLEKKFPQDILNMRMILELQIFLLNIKYKQQLLLKNNNLLDK